MAGRAAQKLNFSRKLLLSAAGIVAIALPLVFGLANATQTRAESQPENMTVAESVAASPESPAHSRGESLAENKAAARAGDIGNYIAALGTVTPVNTVSVTSRVQGQIMDVRYTEGQMVHKGDPLLDIDPRPYQAALTQMEGQLARDQAVLNEARINANAGQQMGFQAQTILQDEGAVQNDEGQVQIARVNLEYCHITSPIDGRVGLRLVDSGNLVQANGTNPLVVITQIQPITVTFNVGEDYLPQIERQLRQGQRLAVDVFDRTQTKKFASGYLLAADNRIDTTTGTVKLRAIFPNTDSSLFPNQFVNVRMEKGAVVQATQVQSTPTIASAPLAVFDVASIKLVKPSGGRIMIALGWPSPGEFTVTAQTVQDLITWAYGIQNNQIVGAPKWFNSDGYDIDAKADESVATELQKLSPNEARLARQHMAQALLADRFKLTIHRETKELPIYMLVIAKGGSKLQESKPDGPHTVRFLIDSLILQGQPVATLVDQLLDRPELGGRMVFDQTGLKGEYDFNLKWTPETLSPNAIQGPGNPPDTSGLSIFTAIQDELGLKLESAKGPVDTLVIDHIEEPSAN